MTADRQRAGGQQPSGDRQAPTRQGTPQASDDPRTAHGQATRRATGPAATATGRQPVPTMQEVANRVRGLQAWMADLDRRLAVRTRIVLALVAVAVGASGSAIYLAVEANRTTASHEDVSRLQNEVDGLRQEVELLREELETTPIPQPQRGGEPGGTGDGAQPGGTAEPGANAPQPIEPGSIEPDPEPGTPDADDPVPDSGAEPARPGVTEPPPA